jgi:hypothetical protein
VLRFHSSEPGSLSIALRRGTSGRLRKLTRTVGAGPGRVALSGRLGRKRMAAGRYRLTVTVRDAAGNRSQPVRLAFKILRG